MVDNFCNMKKTSNRIRSFHFRYMELCRSKNFQPLTEVKAKNGLTSILDFMGDKLKVDDWLLIIESLHLDQTLQHIAIRLRKNCGYVLEHLDNEKKARMLKNKPVISTRFIFVGLIDAITKSLTCNRNLNTLILEALPLNEKCIALISKALSVNENLQTISFSRSLIGDKGCETICCTIKYLLHIENVNMSQCLLTSLGASYIADMIKFQKIFRYSEGWKKSLRYREVKPETIPGLLSIIISQNPEIGDKGTEMIAEILKEDVWIKEIDMSDCGITDIGGKYIINCLEINKYIIDFNFKANPEISIAVQRSIRMQLGKEEDDRDSPMKNLNKKTKLSLPKIREQIKLLEEQIVSEKNFRKQVENLNEQLHAQIMCYEHKLQEQKEMEIPDGYTLIKKDSLDQIIKEKENFKKALSLAKSKESRLQRHGQRARRVKSETKYNLSDFKNRNVKSEHDGFKAQYDDVIPNKPSIYIEKNIGDNLNVCPQKNWAHCEKTKQQEKILDDASCSISSKDDKIEPEVRIDNFKGINEALRLFTRKKQFNNNVEDTNNKLTNVRHIFLGNGKSQL